MCEEKVNTVYLKIWGKPQGSSNKSKVKCENEETLKTMTWKFLTLVNTRKEFKRVDKLCER